MITDSLDNGQKMWSTQAIELQLLRANHKNRKKQGHGFFKMDEVSITMVRDEFANDIYELTTHHKEEINKLLEEFDDKQITIAIELDAYEKERHQQEGELEENGNAEPTKEESLVKLYQSASQTRARGRARRCRARGGRIDVANEAGTTNRKSTISSRAKDLEDEELILFNILNEDADDMEEESIVSLSVCFGQ